jgi:EmrB/QacA subfamily drug resistance transporter
MAISGTRPTTVEITSRRFAAVPVVLAGTFMTILDFFIVNVAIPSAQHDLHASDAGVEFVVAGYGLAYASGLITGGRLGDLYGRRRMYLIGLLAFVATSAACGLATTAGMLIAARVAQGVAAALLFPQVLSILNVTYTGADRARVFAAYGMTLGAASIGGQLLGGLLITADIAGLGWRACFLVNVPIGLAAAIATPFAVPESRNTSPLRLDLRGTLLGTLGLALLLVPLITGRQLGWPAWSLWSVAAAVPVLAGFAAHERALARRGGTPLVPPALFAIPAFRVGITTVFVFYAGMASLFLILALYLQGRRGYDSLAAGAVFLPLGVAFFLTSMQGARLSRRFGRRALALGAVILAVGETALALLAAVGAPGPGTIAACLAVSGAGMGMVMAPLISTVLAGIDGAHTGAASGVLSTTQQVAGAFGVSAIGIIFFQPAFASAPGAAFAAGLGYTVTLALIVAALLAAHRGWNRPTPLTPAPTD